MKKRKLNKNEELSAFITRQCKERRLSFRSLSVNSGLSPSTVHNFVSGKSKPNVASLNAIADYIGVTRVFLWRIAGLLEETDNESEISIEDPRVKLIFSQVSKMPEEKRNVILKVVETLIVNLK